ncbi:hypothetical protein [Alteromonas lipotrueae]|uniref:hypothetical protein n=1 Tax=Alteromonas lipotrueae TaxID=2803814 RepID=UPI001C4887B9|nr:hypothetical protein [Alteromonas lipotrueae]
MKSKYAIGIICLLFIQTLSADTVTGKVSQIWVNQKVWFRLDTMPSASNLNVECNVTARFVADATTDKGRAIYSAILMAKASGKEVLVVGGGNCDLHSDSEGIAYISILP